MRGRGRGKEEGEGWRKEEGRQEWQRRGGEERNDGLAVHVSYRWKVFVEVCLYECHGFHAELHGVDTLVR